MSHTSPFYKHTSQNRYLQKEKEWIKDYRLRVKKEPEDNDYESSRLYIFYFLQLQAKRKNKVQELQTKAQNEWREMRQDKKTGVEKVTLPHN